MLKRKYYTEYIKYGFVSVQQSGECLSLCDLHENSVQFSSETQSSQVSP